MTWLKGKSLRKLGAEIGVSRTTLQTWFRKQYGDGATNRKYTSMARTILEDYAKVDGIETVAINALKVEGNYYSEHSLNMLSEYQCLHDPRLMDIIASEENIEVSKDTWGFLRLPFFMVLTDTLARTLNPFTMTSNEASKTTHQSRESTTLTRAA